MPGDFLDIAGVSVGPCAGTPLAIRPGMDHNADRDTMSDTEAWLPDLNGPLRWSWVQAVGPDILGLIADQLFPGSPEAIAAASSRSHPLPVVTPGIDRRVVWRA
jgi:hypothetical protein